MGMEIEAQDGPATYLRGWGDYQRWSLKLIASDTSGMGVLGLRAWSPDALERGVAAVEAAGLGEGWTDGDLGRGPSYRFRDPDGHRLELYYECERYDPSAIRSAPCSRRWSSTLPRASSRRRHATSGA
jgi:catechol 2,3-dioxygenase